MQRARRENRGLGVSNNTVIEGELGKKKPDGTHVTLRQKTQFGTVKVKKGIYKIKKAI